MFNFIWLLFAHYIGDMALQSQWQATNKRKYWYVMLCHCMIWAAVICVALKYLGIYSDWKAIFLIVFHFVIDTWKSKTTGMNFDKGFKYVYIDQGLHLLQLLPVYIL